MSEIDSFESGQSVAVAEGGDKPKGQTAQECPRKKKVLEVVSVDDHFVPGQETLRVKVKLEGLAAEVVKLRITSAHQDTGNPVTIYELELPSEKKADGEQELTWDGKANCTAGTLKDKLIHPLFSPYKAELFHSDSLKAEKEFKVLVHSIKLAQGPWIPGDAPPETETNKWAQWRLNELGWWGGPVDKDCDDYLKKALIRFKFNNKNLRNDEYGLLDDTIDDKVKAELKLDGNKRAYLSGDALTNPSAESKLFVEQISYQSFTRAGTQVEDFGGRKHVAEAERLNRPLLPLEVEVLLLKRDAAEGLSAPEAVGPLRINWRFTMPDEDLTQQLSPTPSEPSKVKKYLTEALKVNGGGGGKGTNCPATMGGIRAGAADDYASPFFVGDQYEPYTAEKDATQKVVFSTACVDATKYPKRVGKAGVYFRASTIAGDAWKLEAEVDFTGRSNKSELEAAHGVTKVEERKRAKTGTLRVWRTAKVSVLVNWPGAPTATQTFAPTDWDKCKADFATCWLELDTTCAEKAITEVLDEADYKDLVTTLTPHTDPSLITLKATSFVGVDLPTQAGPQTAGDYKVALKQFCNGGFVSPVMEPLSKKILAKTRKTYPTGFIVINFHAHEPVTVSSPDVDNMTSEVTDYVTWCTSMGCADSVVFLDQRDPDKLYFVTTHEMGHGFFLLHWENAGDKNPKQHDRADHNCTMSYTSGSGFQAEGVYTPHFCGKCNLHLRGWDVEAPALPAHCEVEPTDANIEVTVVPSKTDPKPGETYTWTVTAKNNGPQPASGVTIKIQKLPKDHDYVDNRPGAGTAFDGASKWTIAGPLAKDASKTFEIDFKPKDAAAGKRAEHTWKLIQQNESYSVDDVHLASGVVVAWAVGLEVRASVSKADPKEGEEVEFTIQVQNVGPNAASGLELTITRDADLSHESSVASKGTFDAVTGLWTLGDVPVDKAAWHKLTIKSKPAAGSSGKTLEVEGEITTCNEFDTDGSKYWKRATEVEVQGVGLEVRGDPDPGTPLLAGVAEDVDYEWKVQNVGPLEATGLELTATAPAGLTYKSHVASKGTFDQTTGVWTLGAMPADKVKWETLKLKGTVDAGTMGDWLDYKCEITASDWGDPDGNTYWSAVGLVGSKGVGLTVTATPDASAGAKPAEGAEIEFEFKVQNTGQVKATGLQLTATPDAGLTFVSNTAPSKGTFDSGTGVWDIGELAVDASTWQSLKIKAKPDAGTTTQVLQYTCEVTACAQNDLDGDSAHTAEGEITVEGVELDLRAGPEASANELAPEGVDKVFNAWLQNAGPHEATGVKITLTKPAKLTIVSGAPSLGTFDAGTGVWDLSAETIPVDTANWITLAVTAKPDAGSAGTVIDYAMALTACDQLDKNGDAYTKPTAQVTAAGVSLELAQQVPSPAPFVGLETTLKIAVKNKGPLPTTALKVSAPKPAGWTFVRAQTAAGTYDVNTGVWNIGALAKDKQVVLSLVVKADVGTHTAAIDWPWEVQSCTPGDTAGTGHWTKTLSVTPKQAESDLVHAVTKSADVVAGVDAVLNYSLTNKGPHAASNVKVKLELTDAELLSATPSVGTFDKTSGEWTLGDVAKNAAPTMDVTIKAAVTGVANKKLGFKATTTCDQKLKTAVLNSTAFTIRRSESDLVHELGPGPDGDPIAGLDSVLKYSLTNKGPHPATDVKVKFECVNGGALVSGTPSAGTLDVSTGELTIGDMAKDAKVTVDLTVKPETAQGGKHLAFKCTTTCKQKVKTPTVQPNVPVKAPVAALEVTLTRTGSDPAPPGSEQDLKVTLKNAGPQPATNVTVTLTPPPGVTLGSGSPGVGAYATGSWNVPELAKDATAELPFKATFGATAAGTTVAVKAAATKADQKFDGGGQHSASLDVPVDKNEASLKLTLVRKSSGKATVGAPDEHEVTLENVGPLGSTSINVQLDAPLSDVAFSGSGAGFNAGSGTWTLDSLSKGASVKLSFSATPRAGSGSFSVRARILSATPKHDVTPGQATGTVHVPLA